MTSTARSPTLVTDSKCFEVLGLINFKRIRERARVPIGQDIFPYILSHYKGEEYKRAMEAVEEEELLAQKDLRLQPGTSFQLV